MPQPKNRSPLTGNPLRNPGQSLDEEIQTLFEEKVNTWLATLMFSLILTGLDTWRWYAATPVDPRITAVMTLPVMACSLWRLSQLIKRIRRLRMARDGEKVVGQYLDTLRQPGYHVFHDVVGDGFNVDHVIICDRGVFTIETKTYRKPLGQRATIVFNGSAIAVHTYPPRCDLIDQAQAQRAWLKDLLLQSTGKHYWVKPVIVFPGWFVENRASSSQLWVLNPKGLPAFLQNAPVRLSPEDVKLATYHLSRYIRVNQPSPCRR